MKMKKSALRAFLPALLCAAQFSLEAANWPAWNGPSGSGVSTETSAPVQWSEQDNVRWKTPLPGGGNSSPVVWGNRVFLTQPLEKEQKLALLCFDRQNGKLLWQSSVPYTEKEQTHPDNPYASPSPVTDGERVVVWFGSLGVYCYDFEGKELWHRPLGKQTHEWGYAASPVLHGKHCFIHFGPGPRSFLTALDKTNGKPAWEVEIPVSKPAKRTDGFAGQQNGIVGSFSTPIIVQANGRDELVLSLAEQVKAFQPETGKELWSCDGLNPLVYTSPIYGDGVIVAMGGFLGTTIAVKPGGSGDVTATHRLWQTPRTKNRLGSGVVFNGHVYILNTEGIAECLELQTGKRVWDERLKGPGAKSESWSSMILIGDKIYVLNQSGDTIVLRASPKFEVIAINSIGSELTNSTLAVSDGDLFIRTYEHLWCISRDKTRTAAVK